MRIAMQTMLFPTLLLRGDAMLVVCGAHLSIRRRESPARDSLLFLKIFWDMGSDDPLAWKEYNLACDEDEVDNA